MSDSGHFQSEAREAEAWRVLSHYPESAWAEIQPWAPGEGLSGAGIWRVTGVGKEYCLRRWPSEHPGRERLAFIHAVLNWAASAGLAFIPAPLKSVERKTFVESNGHFWDVTPWMPGEADFIRNPTPEKLCAAVAALRLFHTVVQDFDPRTGRLSDSLGFKERMGLLRSLTPTEFERMAETVKRKTASPARIRELAEAWVRIAPAKISDAIRALQAVANEPITLQPAIRDLRAEHVFFRGNEVTGIIDFGAMRIDAKWLDLARLLRTMAGNDAVLRREGFRAYLRPGEAAEPAERIVQAFDSSAAVLTGWYWVRWIFMENRQFPSQKVVEERFEAAINHLKTSGGQGG